MKQRMYEFTTGINTSTQPDAGTPTLANDLITKGYADSAFVQQPAVTGSVGTPQNIVAGTGIAFAGAADEFLHIWFVQGSGGPVDVSANPQIAVGTVIGQRLTLVGVNDTNTVLLEDGTGLKLNGECFLRNGSILELLWNGSLWVEISRNMI